MWAFILFESCAISNVNNNNNKIQKGYSLVYGYGLNDLKNDTSGFKVVALSTWKMVLLGILLLI